MDGDLSPKRAQFVREYLIDLNATQAAIRAGYSPRSAKVTGTRLLADAAVSRTIAEAKAKRAERNELDADWVLSRLKRVAERCLEAEPVLEFDPGEKAMVPKTVMVEDPETGETRLVGVYQFDSKGANGALKLLGDHLGLYVKRIEMGGPDGGPLQHQVVDRPPNETREEWLARRQRELTAGGER